MKMASVRSGEPFSFFASSANFAMASFICGYIAIACVMFGAACAIIGP